MNSILNRKKFRILTLIYRISVIKTLPLTKYYHLILTLFNPNSIFFISYHLPFQSSLRHQMLEAATRDFHLARSATWGAVSMVRPQLFKFFRTVPIYVSFPRPLFPFPWDAHLRATLCSELKGMHRTWPNHRQRLVGMVCDIVVIPAHFNILRSLKPSWLFSYLFESDTLKTIVQGETSQLTPEYN